MTTATAPQYAFVNVNDIAVGGTYQYQGRTVTITDVLIPSDPHGFFEISYMAPTGVQRVNKAPRNRETYFATTF